jgi:Zn-dependent protease/CBS domain-containing protein
MRTSFTIGRLLDIKVKLHFSMLIIVGLFTWALGLQRFTVLGVPIGFGDVGAPTAVKLALGLALSTFIFLSILAHELAHSVVAQRMGFKVRGITLFVFGGVSEMEDMPREPRMELRMALAGPAMSLVMGVAGVLGFVALRPLQGGTPLEVLTIALGTFGFYNLVLAAFKLVPAFPTDGGRVLRALLTMRVGTQRATKTAADVGRTIAILMGVFGILTLNIWLMLIAVFIYMGGSQEEASTQVMLALEHHHVRELMDTSVDTVPPDMTMAELYSFMWYHRHLGYPVVDGGRLVGFVTFDKFSGLDPMRLPSIRVGDVMTKEVLTASPGDDAMEAFKRMVKGPSERLVVVDDDRVAGIVTREDFLRAARLAGA